MPLQLGLGLVVCSPDGRIVVRRFAWRAITDAGVEWLLRCLGDGANRPAVASAVGIGWGDGAIRPFDPAQTDLQGAGRSRKAATWRYDPAANRHLATWEATWGPSEPTADPILYVGEIGLFDALTGGILIDRTPVTPTPKARDDTLRAHAVIRHTESTSGYVLI